MARPFIGPVQVTVIIVEKNYESHIEPARQAPKDLRSINAVRDQIRQSGIKTTDLEIASPNISREAAARINEWAHSNVSL